MIVQLFPVVSFNSFANGLTRVNEGPLRTHLFRSQRDLIRTLSEDRSCEGLTELWFLNRDRCGAAAQASHVHRTAAVHRICFESTELHHQFPVGRSPVVLAFACCAPPTTVLLAVVAVAMSRRHSPCVVNPEGSSHNVGIRKTRSRLPYLFLKKNHAQCSNGRYLPWQPCHKPPETFLKSIHRSLLTFRNSSLKFP